MQNSSVICFLLLFPPIPTARLKAGSSVIAFADLIDVILSTLSEN